MKKEYEGCRDKKRLDEAVSFAAERHAGQFRKGTVIPYLVHPMEVLNILFRMGADTDLMIAGVLHDTIEDTDTSRDEIEAHFGKDVAELVAGHSEDKSKSWDERKCHAIAELSKSDKRFKMLVMADKLSNLRAIASDYKRVGDELWARFNAPQEKQAWYYSEIDDALSDMQKYPDCVDAYWELNGLIKDVFVRFFITDDAIYQMCLDGTGFRYEKTVCDWLPYDGELPDDAAIIMRAAAEAIEDDWLDGLYFSGNKQG